MGQLHSTVRACLALRLMEQLSDYRACKAMGLNDMAHAIGLPGKLGGHGSEVDGMVERSKMDKVQKPTARAMS